MLHTGQFTRSKSHLYSRTCSQKLEISRVQLAKCSVNTRPRLTIYMSVVSKNASMQRVKTSVKTPLLEINVWNMDRNYGYTRYLRQNVPDIN